MTNEENHKLITSFLEKWSIERMKKLKLTDYTNKNYDSFCWDMEKGLLKYIAGIQSGFKTQFGVYQSTDEENYRDELKIVGNREVYLEDFGWQLKWSPKRDNYITNKDDAFVNVINAVNQVIDYAQDGNLEKINEVKLSPNFKWKIAFVYGKQKVMSIPKSSVLENALIQKGIKFKRDDIAFMHEKLLSLKPEDVGFYDYCSEIYDKYSGKNYNHDVDFDNVMVYEVKKSAADNFEDLIHDNGKYFYWNQKKFTNLNMNDYVFLINTTNKYSSFLKLNKKDINIKIKGNNSSFTDEGQKFNVGGKYKKFVRLEIVESLEKDYDWKTLGVSENTFLYGKHCEGLNSANIQRINHLKDIYKKNTKAIEILDTCLNGHEKSTPMKVTQSLNRILFGPPGTGKTFSTINHALSILEDATLDKLKGEKREDVRERYKKYVDSKQIRFTTFHQSYSYEDFIEGIRPQVDNITKDLSYDTKPGVFRQIVVDALDNPTFKFVLIIDEINRGNISDILGELITLLEPSKRFYFDKQKNDVETTEVILPYSGDTFKIPENIFVIGTMNTADRSISVLDTALRRRFDFVELPPNYDDLSSFLNKKGVNKKFLGIDLIELLKKINERIGFLLDKDHMIGHTYFMTVTNKESLVKVFAKNIIPLLEEYFHNDYENIQRVLGDNKIWGKKEEHKIFQEKEEKTTKLFGGEVDGFDDVETFKLNKYFLNESEFSKVPSVVFTQIYEQVKSKSE